MIKKAQIKFVCMTMSILFGVFLIMALITSTVIHNAHNRNVDNTLQDAVQTYQTGVNYGGTNILIAKLSPDKSYEVISVDAESFSDSSIKKIAKNAFSSPMQLGKFNNFYYKMVEIDNQTLLFAFNAKDNMATLYSTQTKASLSFLFVFVALFIIVYLLSFKVFQPIKDAFIKQKQFVSNASHELKTPISIISANTDVLMQTENNKWLDNVKTQTERMNTLVNDMLEMAKMDENKPVVIKEDMDLSEEIIQNTLPFDAVAFEKGKTLVLDVQPDIKYQGDRQSVKKIVNILLDNAVKYANYDGIIKVSLTKKNSKITLSVYNTGSAVPESYANKVFERFYRIDNSRARESGGSGLGLSIAKTIADVNRWKISAESRLDEYMIINVVF